MGPSFFKWHCELLHVCVGVQLTTQSKLLSHPSSLCLCVTTGLSSCRLVENFSWDVVLVKKAKVSLTFDYRVIVFVFSTSNIKHFEFLSICCCLSVARYVLNFGDLGGDGLPGSRVNAGLGEPLLEFGTGEGFPLGLEDVVAAVDVVVVDRV